VEAGGKLVAVKVVALGRSDGAELGARSTADTGTLGADGLAEGTKLLGVVAVRAEGAVRATGEGGRKGTSGGLGVRLRSVVDVG